MVTIYIIDKFIFIMYLFLFIIVNDYFVLFYINSIKYIIVQEKVQG